LIRVKIYTFDVFELQMPCVVVAIILAMYILLL